MVIVAPLSLDLEELANVFSEEFLAFTFFEALPFPNLSGGIVSIGLKSLNERNLECLFVCAKREFKLELLSRKKFLISCLYRSELKCFRE